MAKKNPEAPAEVEAQPATEAQVATGAGGQPVPTPVRGPKGVAAEAIITMGTNKDGVAYGPENNPKKTGTKTHGRFAQYRNGMTIKEALDAGIQTADLVYDKQHGFVLFGDPLPAAPAAPVAETATEQQAAVVEGQVATEGGAATEQQAAAD